jgi:D-alanyl-lipoteichoic acid acyltransferase DltB (MBOAT superfamily)
VTFHSLDFLVFFVVVVVLYWRLGHRYQNWLLLVGSYVFYGWIHTWFLLLIFASTFVDYWAARAMGPVEAEDRPGSQERRASARQDVQGPQERRASARQTRRHWLLVSLAANIGLLGFFKYFNFFVDNVFVVLEGMGLGVPKPALEIVLPVGISFYTFQTLSYTIDVYRGRLEPRRSFLDIAVFVAFFPQLVAGPIERASHLLPQVERARAFSADLARSATVLMAWGFFKKLVIADNVGVIANKVFALADPSFLVLWAGVFAFGIQIYADFSAYSDIARGTARWLGFDVMRNFDHPYVATGPADFWHRWHISLSTWFRDYVYIPLGGSRTGTGMWARNVMITFVVSGFWHGASWNFVIWGCYHGALLVVARALAPFEPRGWWRRAAAPVQRLAMFALANVGWLMFREREFDALVRDVLLSPWAASAADRQTGAYLFLLAAVYSLPLWLHAAWDARPFARARDEGRPTYAGPGWIAAQALLCGVLFALILVFRSREALAFIYFRF